MNEPVNRHEFLRSLGRKGLLLGLAGLSVAALKGTKNPSECINTYSCASCYAYRPCTLPEKKEANDERENKTRSA